MLDPVTDAEINRESNQMTMPQQTTEQTEAAEPTAEEIIDAQVEEKSSHSDAVHLAAKADPEGDAVVSSQGEASAEGAVDAIPQQEPEPAEIQFQQHAETADTKDEASITNADTARSADVLPPALEPSAAVEERHVDRNSTHDVQASRDLEPSDADVLPTSRADKQSTNSAREASGTVQDDALIDSATVSPDTTVEAHEDVTDPDPSSQPIPAPLDPVESATFDLRMWLRPHDAEAYTAIIVASFMDAGYPPHEWVDTLEAFSPDELTGFLEAVASFGAEDGPAENSHAAQPGTGRDDSGRAEEDISHDPTTREDQTQGTALTDLEVEMCASNPCQNGGRCSQDLGVFWCECLDGFRGDTCGEDTDECASRPCRNGATCQESGTGGDVNVGHYVCVCARGWRGLECDEDVNECLSSPCVNGGTCTQEVDSYSCACVAGFEDENCAVDTSECASDPCANGGACVEITPPAAPFYECNCSIGFAGADCSIDIDECMSAPCQNGGTCTHSVGVYACQCPDGFSGTACDEDVPCASVPCQNGGDCVSIASPSSSRQDYECACLSGFEGSHCGINMDECASTPCQNGATCVDGPGTFTCNCTAGFDGSLCSQDADECASRPCENGGTCTQTPFYVTATGAVPVAPYYSCECVEGFQGDNCEIDVDECDSSPCQNGGRCEQGLFHRDEIVARFSCSCPDGLAGELCERDINECISSPCVNGGTCTESSADSAVAVGSFACQCPSGYTGSTCGEDVDECASQPCKNRGACVEAGAPRFFRCLCREGFAGDTCGAVVVDKGECDSQPCRNGGVCEDSQSAPGVVAPGMFLCDCQRTEFVGEVCDIVSTPKSKAIEVQNHTVDEQVAISSHSEASGPSPSLVSEPQNASIDESSIEHTFDVEDAQKIAREAALKHLLASQDAHGAAMQTSGTISTDDEQKPLSGTPVEDDVMGGQPNPNSTVGVDSHDVEEVATAEEVVDAAPAINSESQDAARSTALNVTDYLSGDESLPADVVIASALETSGTSSKQSQNQVAVNASNGSTTEISEKTHVDDEPEMQQATPAIAQPEPPAPVAQESTPKPSPIAAARRAKVRKIVPLPPDEAPGNEVFGGSSMVFLDVRQIGDVKLVKLQNPVCGFDPVCGEWQGDWSDNSTLWEHHPRVAMMLKPKVQPDGVFWMPFGEYQSRFHGTGTRKTPAASLARGGDRIGGRPIQRNGRSTDPDSQKSEQQEEEATPSAAEFLASVREHFDGGVGYAYFLRLLKLYSTGNQTAAEVHVVVQQLFQGAPHLIRGFNALVPPPPKAPTDEQRTKAAEQDGTAVDVEDEEEEDDFQVDSVAEETDDGMPEAVGLIEPVEDVVAGADDKQTGGESQKQQPVGLDPCESTPCVAGSTCTSDPSTALGFNCTCAVGYAGVHCEVAECPAGYWESAKGGRACAPLSVCNFTLQFEAVAPNKTRDRLCLPIREPCDADTEFELASPTNESNRVCKMAQLCEAGSQYEAAPLRAHEDRICNPIRPPCEEGVEWQAAPPTASRDRDCRTVTKCGEHQLERSPPGPHSDRVCYGLGEAAAKGSPSLVAQLISRGGTSLDLNAKNEYGHTPLHEVAAAASVDVSSHDRLAVVDKLLDGGADAAAQNLKGHTPLHIAADVGNADAASALLSRRGRGVDVNAVDSEGNTPLHFAAEMGHSAVAEVLLESGAVVGASNSDGRTPAHLTESIRWHAEKHGEIVRILKRYGGELRRS